MKIFNIGLSKTGTNSLVEALGVLGYNVLHYPPSDIVGAVEQCDGCADIPTALKYKELDKRFPGSKFILTVRDKKSWLKSINKHFHRRPISTLGSWGLQNRVDMYGGKNAEDCDFSRVYDKHHLDVFNYFKNRKEDLLILNICDGEGWDKLCQFLGHEVPDMQFPKSNEAPKKKESIDVVIPYVDDGEEWSSLRYVLRSVEQNFIDLNNVWIIGDFPSWANPDNHSFKFISNPRLDTKSSRVRNAHYCKSMYLAALDPNITDDFLYMADDHYLASPRTAEDFRTTVLVRENMADYTQIQRRTADREWQDMIWKTVDRLLDHNLTGWNYETHTPKLVNKLKLLNCFAFFGFGDGNLIWQTAYFNMYPYETTSGKLSEKTPLKAGFYENFSPTEIKERCDAAIYINHNDDGLNNDLKEYIEGRFPEPSKYENPES